MFNQNRNNVGGVNVPTERYDISIIENFPIANSKIKVEGTIAGHNWQDFLPVNASFNNGSVRDSFIEFNVNPADDEFIDLQFIKLELVVNITDSNGIVLNADANPRPRVSLVDGFMHRLLQSHSLYLNNIQVEGNSNFGLYNTIKTYIHMDHNKLSTYGRNMLYKSLPTRITETVDDGYFNENQQTSEEHIINNSIFNPIHLMGPLMLDISNSQYFLLNGIGMRLRFELAAPSVVLNSHDEENYRYSISSCKLWIKKIIPYPSAITQLNNSIQLSPVEYFFTRPVIKTHIFHSGQNTLTVDSAFQGIIPHLLYIFMIKQSTEQGVYRENASYLPHNNLSNIHIELDSNTIANINCSFPNNIARIFSHTLDSIPDKNNLITHYNFSNGRTILAFDLRQVDAKDCISLEKSGNLRIKLSISNNLTHNQIVYFVGLTTGVLRVNQDRRIFPNYLN